MEHLGVAVLGVAVLETTVLGTAVLGTAVLQSQTRSLPTQHSFRRLFPQSISNDGVALNMKMVKGYGTPWCGRAWDRRG